ncbi:L-serine ammonia-lyase, iron-sulfur-dependent, subunit alpha [Alistipes sp. OttesenSCG-928-B03]|nr:L-serine ammonia-lyase, iron-sulfur-dependent, subunit alpha [Alistipes sp. OttesenSCG-928-B03]
MESLKQLYKIGNGPSSSHTIGPRKAALQFAAKNPAADSYRVTLYGSLAATGKGHFTDKAILEAMEPSAPTEIVWEPTVFLPFHPNGMKFEAQKEGAVADEWTIFSVGGGALANENTPKVKAEEVYPLNKLAEIQEWCDRNGSSYWEYVEHCEGEEIWDYLMEVWQTMRSTIEIGLEKEGVIPGGLGVRRKASTYLVKSKGHNDSMASRGKLYAYALATSEENASGGVIVTAPTCGASGVLPAILYHLKESRDFSDIKILRALATAGLFGNVVKTNGSISGAEVGCQGEVGVACAMAAAAASQLFGGTPAQIEYAAEMALEHHLGLTCDPVCGLVQIPCIERNAIAAARAFDTNIYAMFSDGKHRVSFDRVVDVMRETGHDIPSLYKETAEGGLAKNYDNGGGKCN